LKIVADASALVDFLIGNMSSSLDKKEFRASLVYAPDLIINEAISALTRLWRNETISNSLYREALEDLTNIPAKIVSSRSLIKSMPPKLGHISAYDAAYVCLAENLQIPFYTTDAKLSKVAQKYCEVKLVQRKVQI
jgi:predicted nucleic acid-binding protein